MLELKWVEAPPPAPKTKWAEIFTLLREHAKDHPNEWAIVAEGVNSAMATLIRQGNLGGEGAAEPGEFEATARRREDGDGYDIYARLHNA